MTGTQNTGHIEATQLDAGSSIDPRAFRSALGAFATGVTIITACGPDSALVGVTCNSFNSVSLDPALVLWSLDCRALSRGIFEQATHFTVNVLAEDQLELSNRFASKGVLNKFEGTAWSPGLGGAPILSGCAAHFECRVYACYDGGDHRILIGQVERFEQSARSGLLYHKGGYAVSGPHPVLAPKRREKRDSTVRRAGRPAQAKSAIEVRTCAR